MATVDILFCPSCGTKNESQFCTEGMMGTPEFSWFKCSNSSCPSRYWYATRDVSVYIRELDEEEFNRHSVD